MEYLAYFNALNRISSLTPRKFFYLLKLFGNNPKTVWNASYRELKKSNLDEKIIDNVITERKSIDPEREIQKLLKYGIAIAIHPDVYAEPQSASARNASPDRMSCQPTRRVAQDLNAPWAEARL